MRSPLLLTITLLTLAGCVGAPDAPVDAASAPGAANATTSPPVAGAPDANATLPPVEAPFAFDGKVPMYARGCAFAVAVAHCVDAPPGADFSASHFESAPAGKVVSGSVVATWSAASPTTEELVVYAFSYDGESWQSHGWTVGPSGVTLELEELSAFVAGGTLAFGVSVPGTGAGVIVAEAWGSAVLSEQAFHLEGLVATEAPPQA